jgi:hypothetical protein
MCPRFSRVRRTREFLDSQVANHRWLLGPGGAALLPYLSPIREGAECTTSEKYKTAVSWVKPLNGIFGRSRWDKRGSGGASNEVGETI